MTKLSPLQASDNIQNQGDPQNKDNLKLKTTSKMIRILKLWQPNKGKQPKNKEEENLKSEN